MSLIRLLVKLRWFTFQFQVVFVEPLERERFSMVEHGRYVAIVFHPMLIRISVDRILYWSDRFYAGVSLMENCRQL